MKKYLILLVALAVVGGLFLVFSPNFISGPQPLPLRNTPTVEQSTQTPVINKNVTDTPVINSPVVPSTPEVTGSINLQDTETVANSLSDRIRAQKNLLERTNNPVEQGQFTLEISELKERCLNLVNEHNREAQKVSAKSLELSLCD